MQKDAANAIPNELLKSARLQKNLSQQELGERLDPVVDKGTVSRWERGSIKAPHQYQQRQLAEILKRTYRQLGFTNKGEIPFWDLKGRKQNPLFTGREDILLQLATIPKQRDEYNKTANDD